MNKNERKPKIQKGLVDPKSITEYTVYVETGLLDFLLFKLKNTPRKTVKTMLSKHCVAVNGVPVSQFDYPLVKEDVVTISKNRIAKHNRKDLPIIFEDEDIIAINKPSGLLSVATDKEKGRTAYRLISDYVSAKSPKNRIYVVHRLDEDTSGVLVFAKSNEVRTTLQNHWQEIVKDRGYYAIVEGKMEEKEGCLRDYLDQNDLHLVYVTKNKAKGKLSITNYKEMAVKGPYSLLDVHIDSGRKNQIRVQLGHRGHYVIGDDKYGEPSNPIGRLGLHAYSLRFTNPKTGKDYHFEVPMPEPFKKLMFGKGDPEKKEQPKAERATRSQTKIAKGKRRSPDYFGQSRKGGKRA